MSGPDHEPLFFDEDLAEEGQLQRLNGAELYFEVTGDPQDEAPIVYLHGGPGYNSASFRELFGDRLEGRSVVYLDQRGCGRSGALSDTDQGGESLDLDTLVADVEALREYLEVERIVPLGHGFGALIALEYARRHPRHTERVIVVNPWLHFPELAYALLAEASALSGQEVVDPAGEVRAATPQGQYPAIGAARVEAAFALVNARDLLSRMQFPDEQSRMHLEFVDAQTQLMGGGEMQEALVGQGLWEFEYPPFLEEIRRPVEVIAGVYDRSSYPGQAAWLADLIGADVTVLEAGHYPWLDDEDAFTEALEDALRR